MPLKRLLILVDSAEHLPFFWQVREYLSSRGWVVEFVAFTARENLWLRRNGVQSVPGSVHAIRAHRSRQSTFSDTELTSILAFSVAKGRGPHAAWEQRAHAIEATLTETLEANSFDGVLIWNGDEFSGKILSLLAQRRGIKTLFIENGYFADTMQVDLDGVNVNSSLTKLSFEEIRQDNAHLSSRRLSGDSATFALAPYRKLSLLDYGRLFLQRKLDPAYYLKFPELRGGSAIQAWKLARQRKEIQSDSVVLPKKYVFIPFQVHDDTQIILNSPLFESIEEFFEHCHAAIRKNFGEEYEIVIKEHPEDLCRYSYESLKEKYPDVLWLRKFDINALLDKAAIVFVINSSVGLQAIAKAKPTVTFGKSFYARDEICFPVHSLDQLDGVLNTARNGVSRERVRNIDIFVDYLRQSFFVAGGWSKLTGDGVRNLGHRIEQLLLPVIQAPSNRGTE